MRCWGRDRTRRARRSGSKGFRWTSGRCRRSRYGAAMQYFTGSKDHNVALRQRALRMGLTLNEYGLFRIEDEGTGRGSDGGRGSTGRSGLAWIPPELRENCGEIEAAASRERCPS